jgi:hypothetical protein
MNTTPFFVDLTNYLTDTIPVIEPTAVIVHDVAFAGAWTVAGDVDGDGQTELVTARLWEKDDVHATATVSVCRLDGSVLWTWGNPGDGVAALHNDAACQIYDWDRDGRQEVVIVTHTDVIMLDGATGAEKFRFETPGRDAADCIAFANLSDGVGADIIIKNRYHKIWAYNWHGKHLWEIEYPAGMKTAHQPFVINIDNDGYDEVIVGYALLNHKGKIVWSLNSDALKIGQGHLDCARVLRRGQEPEDWRLVLTCCGDNALLCLDGNGELVWEHRGQHFESINVGHFIPGDESKQILVDIDHRTPGKSPQQIFNEDGKLLGEINSIYGRIHPLIKWGDMSTEHIVACEDRLLVSGATGEPLSRLATPMPDGVKFEQQERALEHINRGAFHLIGQTGNIFGNGRQDLMLSTNPGGVIWLYDNPGEKSQDLPLGTGENVTLY